MNIEIITSSRKQLYYRLIALWAVCEGMLGGIIHGFNLPVTGLIVGSGAVIIICLIGFFVPEKGSIIKATIIVAIFKLMLSPQSPLPAYFAVFFQGITGELVFSFLRSIKAPVTGRFYKILCIIFATLALMESGLQRIVVTTLIYGTAFWKAVNDFINGLTHQKSISNYSLLIAGSYVALHFIAGLFIGFTAATIPANLRKWKQLYQPGILINTEETIVPKTAKKNTFWRKGLFLVWTALLMLFFQSEFKVGRPLLSSDDTLHILIRSALIFLSWYFLVSPLLTFFMKKWLERQKIKSKSTINDILLLIPSIKYLLLKCWQYSRDEKGLRRLQKFLKIALVNSLYECS
ncbi:MAG: hypothetical protein H0W62_06955 [Chitinophagales bacterium]|nr:hypothetical protein [Chitinophagales bacterium]